ncbi:MAG: CAP domain-containing protein, partial [Akkermansiaceae bacterium]|nr:CAP domain-containing protein [Akkermansiaceae bacterium]
RGIEESNEWRMLVGLNGLVIDPKLCGGARDHSKDMQEKGFFAHDSPVPGKKTPWDRAKNFGTSASGENIFMGSGDPHGANQGWFYSPGHHKNMFNPGQLRIGLGNAGSHWTQMFGR